MQTRSTLQMLTLSSVLAAYALGAKSSSYAPIQSSSLSKFIQKPVAYQSIITPWTIDKAVLSQIQSQIEQIVSDNRQPVLIWDPVLPRTFADTMAAIVAGLADQYIVSFFQLIKTVQSKQNFTPIIVLGTAVNTQQSYSSNASSFIKVFQKVVLYSVSQNISAKFAFSLSPMACTDPKPVPINCTNGWTYDKVKQQMVQCDNESEPVLEVTNNSNPYTELNCSCDQTQFYPGDSYVDWIALQIVDYDGFQSAQSMINKAVQLAETVSKAKPLMWFVGSRSEDGTQAKSQFIKDTEYWAETYQKPTKFSIQTLKSLVFDLQEGNSDTSFYDSTYGDTISSTTQNGVRLFTYSALASAFYNSSALSTYSLPTLAVGSLCSPGECGDLSFVNCKPCPTGQYQNISGQQQCLNCPIGTYQDSVGQTLCKACPGGGTTLSTGTQRADYCVCQNNYFMEQNICVGCPKNTYARSGQSCQNCPSDAQFKGSNGGPGQGCFCLIGYKWDSRQGECVQGGSSGVAGAGLIIGAGVLAAGLLVG